MRPHAVLYWSQKNVSTDLRETHCPLGTQRQCDKACKPVTSMNANESEDLVYCALASLFAVTFTIVRIAATITLLRFLLCPLAFPESLNVSVLHVVCGKMRTHAGSAEASHTQVSSITGVKSRITGARRGRGWNRSLICVAVLWIAACRHES